MKMIERLTKIMKNETSTEETTTSCLTKPWAEKVEEEDSKNESESQNVVVDPIDEQLGKKIYVIFDGPMAGIYQKWAINKTFIEGKKVRHKSYSTMEEAKATFSAAYKGPVCYGLK